MNLLEIGGVDLTGIFVLVGLILVGPPILFVIIGTYVRKKYKQAAAVFYILAALYLIIGFGMCFGGL